MTSPAPLKGVALLVTRPKAQAEPWAQQLKALGAEAFIQSMMEIAPLNDDVACARIRTQVQRLDEYQKAIFVSQNAVNHGIAWVDQYWPQLPIGIDFFAIGQMTAKVLQDSAIMASAAHLTVNGDAMNSESLLSMAALEQVDGEKILIFRGRGGRDHLGDKLRARGAFVEYCETYERRVPSDIGKRLPQGFYSRQDTVSIATVHSGETLENLVKVVAPDQLSWLKQQPLLLPGQRVANIAKALGFDHLIVAANATHEGMIEALYEWQKRRQ